MVSKNKIKGKQATKNIYENTSYVPNEQNNIYETINQQRTESVNSANDGVQHTIPIPRIPSKAKMKNMNLGSAFNLSNRKLCVVSTIAALIMAFAVGLGVGYILPNSEAKQEMNEHSGLTRGSQYILCTNYFNGHQLYVTPNVSDKWNITMSATSHGVKTDLHISPTTLTKSTPQLYILLYKAFGYSTAVLYFVRSPFTELNFNTSVSLIQYIRDGFFLIPRKHVGKHYMLATIESKKKYTNRIQIFIATYEYETNVTFMTKDNKLAKILKNNVSLKAWTCNRYVTSNVYDITGLEIKSDNIISIFLLQYVVLKIDSKPSTLYGYSYTNNQLLPVNELALQFLIPKFQGKFGSYKTYIRIVSIGQNNTIYITSGNDDMTSLKYTTKILQHGESYQINENALSHSIKCNIACSVVTYLQYVKNSTMHTAPASTIIPDLTLFYTGKRIINPGITRSVSTYPDNSLVIVTTENGIRDLLLNGQPVVAEWFAFPKTGFVYTNMNKVNRTNTLLFESKTAPYKIYYLEDGLIILAMVLSCLSYSQFC